MKSENKNKKYIYASSSHQLLHMYIYMIKILKIRFFTCKSERRGVEGGKVLQKEEVLVCYTLGIVLGFRR